ncbi:TRAP transporter small permease [Falsihalocynthiibacter sp. S25ZX9]|uniref:TRAP transporter small permease n=1 Tax=Falsihalocynthiibacter sp. S25ZX9 TaxID=3240870 RepID=UPI00350EA839
MHFLDKVANGLLQLLGIMLIAMVCLSVYNVISRYVFNSALLWADEIAVFAMIALGWLGAVVCGWRNSEIRMDILSNLMPQSAQRILQIFQQAVIAVLCGWVALQSVPYITRTHAIGMRSDASGFPVWLIHIVIPVSLVLIALIAALRCLRLIAGKDVVFAPVTPTKRTVG